MNNSAANQFHVRTLFPNLRDELLEYEEGNLCKNSLIKSPEIEIKINNVIVHALLDTGSSVNGVSEEWLNSQKTNLGYYECLPVNNTNIISAIGKKSKNIKRQILCEVDVKGNKYNVVFLVIPGLIRDCILGMGFLKQAKGVINIPDCYIQLETEDQESEEVSDTFQIPLLTMYSEDGESIINKINKKLEEIDGVDETYVMQLRSILLKNQQVFSSKPGRIRGYEHHFSVTDDTPYMQKGWPVPLAYQEAVRREIEQMIDYGIIERANTPYINPLVPVIKKNKSVRLCLDARRINNVTVPDYDGPSPINEILAKCGNIHIMSTIDLTSSFWQVPLRQDCRNYTGFMYEGRCYRFAVTPFGLKTSLSSLTRGMDTVLTEEVKKHTIIYVDDCLCFSDNIHKHLQDLDALLTNLRTANITVNIEKTHFFRKEINYLGFCLSTEGIRATPDKVAAIRNFPTPKNAKQLKSFLGLTNFYNKFSSKYAEKTQPLLKLLQKGNKFKWNQELETQFNLVKELFIETVVLKFPKQGQRFFLQCDASEYAYGGQLFQLDEHQEIAVIAYTSRTFHGAERRYFTTEKELLAIVLCLKKFRIYVLGQPLTIITDNKALTFMQRCHLNNSRITRWILGIQEYNFEILHCKGRNNIVADILSRYPEDLTEDEPLGNQHEIQMYSIILNLGKNINKKLKHIDKEQCNDHKLNNIMCSLQTEPNSKLHQFYKIYNNKLYKKCKHRWRLYVPTAMREELIIAVHAEYGHIGSNKLYHLLSEHFIMEAMLRRIKQITKTCDMCQRYKDGGNRNIVGITQPILPTRKGELVSVDYYGPLPTSTSGVKYLLVVVDNFTKYVELYTLRRATTTATLRRIHQYITAHGKPEYLLTDNGTQFTTEKWTRGIVELGITPKFTAIRNPCTNIAERWNRQLGNLFRIFVHERHSKWASQVKIIQKCLNETYQSTIEMTPYEAQFGRKPKRNWEKYLDSVMIGTEPINLDKIQLRIHEKGKRQAERQNETANIIEFAVGDKVLIRAQQSSDATQKIISKFCELFEGPYSITRRIGQSTYELSDVETGKVRGVFNTRVLKRYFPSNLST